jgi:hypothetical protein
MDRAYSVLQTNYNRVLASREQLAALSAKEAAGENVPLDLLLDAQRRVADTEAEYAHNRARYAVSTKNVHFVKGTLLDHDGVYLAEGPWPSAAYQDAAEREALRGKARPLNAASSQAPSVSAGPYSQIREERPAPPPAAGETLPEPPAEQGTDPAPDGPLAPRASPSALRVDDGTGTLTPDE